MSVYKIQTYIINFFLSQICECSYGSSNNNNIIIKTVTTNNVYNHIVHEVDKRFIAPIVWMFIFCASVC